MLPHRSKRINFLFAIMYPIPIKSHIPPLPLPPCEGELGDGNSRVNWKESLWDIGQEKATRGFPMDSDDSENHGGNKNCFCKNMWQEKNHKNYKWERLRKSRSMKYKVEESRPSVLQLVIIRSYPLFPLIIPAKGSLLLFFSL